MTAFQRYTFRISYIGWKVSEFEDFSGPYFPVLALNTDIYKVNLRIQSKYGNIRTKGPPNLDIFHIVRKGVSIPLFQNHPHIIKIFPFLKIPHPPTLLANRSSQVFIINPIAWMSRNSLLKTGAISEV